MFYYIYCYCQIILKEKYAKLKETKEKTTEFELTICDDDPIFYNDGTEELFN